MKQLKMIVFGILNLLIRASIAYLVVLFVYRAAMASYHFGYMIFTDKPKDVQPGHDITVTIEEDAGAMDISKTLEKRGVVSDYKLFFVQEYLSEYHKELKPGTYTLNTSMRPSEILAELANANGETEPKEGSSETNKDTNITTPANSSGAGSSLMGDIGWHTGDRDEIGKEEEDGADEEGESD